MYYFRARGIRAHPGDVHGSEEGQPGEVRGATLRAHGAEALRQAASPGRAAQLPDAGAHLSHVFFSRFVFAPPTVVLRFFSAADYFIAIF